MKKIIEVENLSKKYTISRERDAYNTLVGAISKKTKQLKHYLKHPLSSLPKQHSQEEFWALKDVSFSVNEGDRLGIIGRNGAGKSTLFKLLSRITSPTSGQAKIRGRISSLLEVGTGFHLELTGRENIFLNGAILGMTYKEIKQKFDAIVSFSEIEKFLDTPMKRYSNGMYTRLGFAVAAYLDPDILIVDEVLAVGDIQFQQKCLTKLNSLSSEGRTILFVSHDIGAVLSLCNKGLYLENGQVKLWGDINDCANAYMANHRDQSSCWEGDCGDEHIRFHRVSWSGPDSSREFVYQGEKLSVDIDCLLKEKGHHIGLGIEVWNRRNQLIASSHTWDDHQSSNLISHLGPQRVGFNLDTSLFHEGEYTIKLNCILKPHKLVLQDEIALRLPVYSTTNNIRTRRQEDRSGIFLGNHWIKH